MRAPTGCLIAFALCWTLASLHAQENPLAGGGGTEGARNWDTTVQLPANDTDPVAIVNGQPISKADFVQRLVEWHGPGVLEEMITRALVDQEIQRLGVTNTPEEINQRVDLQVKMAEDELKQQSGGQMALAEFLKTKGETMESFRSMLFHNDNFQKQIALEKMVQYSLLTEEAVEVQHIVVEHEVKAREIHELLHKGADFAKLAAERSEDQISGQQGGRLAPFIYGLSPMGIAFDEIVFKLKDGELSDVVSTQPGRFHVVKKLSSRPAKNTPYSEIKDQVWKDLVTQPINKRAVMAYLFRMKFQAREKIKIELKRK